MSDFEVFDVVRDLELEPGCIINCSLQIIH